MKIVIAGGSGFLGTALARRLVEQRHEVVTLSRRAGTILSGGGRAVAWNPDGRAAEWAGELDGAAAVVNLAGESIAAGRWSDARKQRITESRVLATRSLVAAIAQASAPPPVLVSGSAVGYYGPRGDEVVSEDTAAGHDFLADVCVKWETEARRAETAKTRVVLIRTGLVLERDGGALPPMLLPFRLFAGGPVGSGRQYWPWIHRQDWVDLVRFAIDNPQVSGPINVTAPQPVTNRDFARALGRAMHRPAVMPTPGFVLKLMMGEMAEALILSGQRAVPMKAERLGFSYSYPRLDSALAALFGQGES
jgi:uncharacterized protein (TIGR01777 family)